VYRKVWSGGWSASATADSPCDVARLLDRDGLGDATALVDQKRQGERKELPAALRVVWARRVGEVFALLDRAAVETSLPAESPNAS
jgi:hypothetical protein